MSVFDFIGREFDYNTYKRLIVNVGLSPKKQFWKDLKIKKSRKSFECSVCRKKLPAGTRYLGDRWERICYKCAEKWIKNSNKTLIDIQNEFKSMLNEINKNKQKWNRELIVNSLK